LSIIECVIEKHFFENEDKQLFIELHNISLLFLKKKKNCITKVEAQLCRVRREYFVIADLTSFENTRGCW